MLFCNPIVLTRRADGVRTRLASTAVLKGVAHTPRAAPDRQHGVRG